MDCLFWTSRRHWWQQVNSSVIEFHLSNTSGSRRERTRIACLVDRDSNHCAISLPQHLYMYLHSVHNITNKIKKDTYDDRTCKWHVGWQSLSCSNFKRKTLYQCIYCTLRYHLRDNKETMSAYSREHCNVQTYSLNKIRKSIFWYHNIQVKL